MSITQNFYLGIARGQTHNTGNVTVGTSSGATAADVELRMQIDNGTGKTGLTKKDVIIAMEVFEKFILSNGIPDGGTPGTDLPAN